jgi:MoxR-like ATPase
MKELTIMKFNKHIYNLFEAIDPKRPDPVKKAGFGEWGDLYNAFNPGGLNMPMKMDPDYKSISQINHTAYESILRRAYGSEEFESMRGEEKGSSKGATLIYGKPGIGKSAGVKKVLKEIGQREGFDEDKIVNFMALDINAQNEVLANPKDYFVLIDVRVANFEATDFMGIPYFDNETDRVKKPDEQASGNEMNFLRTKKYKWAYLATHPDTKGFVFFDEITQALPEVVNAMYAVILERYIFDQKISDGVAIIAAGNLEAHDPTSGNMSLTKALTRRFASGGVYSLHVTAEEWLEFARNNHIHPTIIAFIESDKKNSFYKTADDVGANDRFADPDTLVAMSKLFYNVEQRIRNSGTNRYIDVIQEYDRIARSTAGGGWASNFIKFLSTMDPKTNLSKNSEATPPAIKWSNITTIQQAVTLALLNDPELKGDRSKQIVKYATDWAKKQDEGIQQAFAYGMTHHTNNNIATTFDHLDIITSGPEFDGINGSADDIDKALDINSIKKFTSEYSSYENEQDTTNLISVNHKTYKDSLNDVWDTNEALLIYGDPGIGKSWAIEKFGRDKAKELGLEFVYFNKLNHDEREEIVNQDLSRFFFFVVAPVPQMSSTDFMGIPNIFKDPRPYLSTDKYIWAWLATRPNVTGILFFDEINQAERQVLNAMYQVVNSDDRTIFDQHISDNMRVLGAGNLASQENATAEKSVLSRALTRRFKAGSIVLELTGEEWFEWAKEVNKEATDQSKAQIIHPIIMQYVATRSNQTEAVFVPAVNEEQYDMNPDALRQISKSLFYNDYIYQKNADNGMDDKENSKQFTEEVKRILAGAPTQWAQDVFNFLFMDKNIDWDYMMSQKHLMSNPQELQRQGNEGSSLLNMFWGLIIKMQEVMKTVQKDDPNLEEPNYVERITEIMQYFISLNKQYRSSFVTYFKRIGIEELKAFHTFINKSHFDKFPKELVEEFNTHLLEAVKFASTATGK